MSWMGRERLQQAATAPVTVEVTEPGKPWLSYRYDERRGKLVVERVVTPQSTLPVNRGIVPRTLTSEGRPLEVWFLSDLSPMPGAIAQVRPIGLLSIRREDGQGESALLAVLDGEPGYDCVYTLSDLPRPRTEEILSWLGESREAVMQGADAARALLRECLERAARARVEAEKGSRSTPAWRALGVKIADTDSADPFTPSERDVLRLPYRFQRYVGRCLNPNERILQHVTRPPISDPSSRLRLLGRRKLHDGLLVLTDRQVLFVEDAIPPDSTLVHWGFIAHCTPPERIAGARVEMQGELSALILDIEAATGGESWKMLFPEDRSGRLLEAETLLKRFIPVRDTHALRRVYNLDSDGQARAGEGLDEQELRRLSELDKRLREELPREERALAEAFAPGTDTDHKTDLLIAATHASLYVLGHDRSLQRFPFAQVSSIGLHHSLIGCDLRMSLVRDEHVERIVLPFVGPAVADLVRLFLIARQALARPNAV